MTCFRRYRNLEIRIRVQGSFKVIKTGTIQQIGYGFLLVFYRNITPRHTVFQVFTFEKYRDLETEFMSQ